MIVSGSWLIYFLISSWHLTIVSSEEPNGHRLNVNETNSRPWVTLDYPDDIALCLHELPVTPKEPLPPNSTFNATEERQVLLEIFSSTAGPFWSNNSGWNETTTYCQWHGVICNMTSGRVIALSLASHNLTGTLPSTMWKLRDLQAICFEGNPGIHGKLADFLASNMTRLMRLDLARASLTGEIPNGIIQGLTSLIKMQLGGNKLGGVIPSSIGQLSELQALSLGENVIKGIIPDSIQKLSKLWFLDLESLSNLHGTIEAFLNLSSLRFMHLSASGLHGTLPDHFGLIFSGLLECLLSENSLHGHIPSTIGNITGLLHLNLGKNKFDGIIPKSLGQLRHLEVLDLSFNSLTGFEESFIFNTTSLSLLTVANNNIGSMMQLPRFLDELQPVKLSLRSLNASSCNFLGNIPNTIWSFTNLIFVDVQNNLLAGTLPLPSDNMLFLSTLDFSGNDLTGHIPEAYAKLLALQTFDVSSNPRLKDDYGGIPRFARPDTSFFLREKKNDRFTCPVIRFKYNNGIIKMDSSYYDRVFCECDKDYYGYKGHCLQCMTGGLCTRHNSSQFSSYMQITRGYWPSPDAYNATHLVSCQKTNLTNSVCSPTGKCNCWANATNERHPFTACDSECICNKGSSSRFCSKCKHNFYSHGGLCPECPTRNSDQVGILFPVIVVGILTIAFVIWLALFKAYRKRSIAVVIIEIVFVSILHIFNFVPSWLLEINMIIWVLGVAGHGRKSRGVLKILIFYIQLLDAMSSNFNVWPSSVLKIQRYFSNIFNFQFEGLECYFPKLSTPVGKLSSLLLLPFCMTAAAGVVFFFYVLLCKIVKARPEKTKEAKHFTLNIVIVFLNLVYFPIVKRSFSALSPCLDDWGVWYMPQYPWIDCPSAEYKVMRILGYCSLVIYILGVPFAVFLPLLTWFLVFRNVENDGEDRDSWLGSLYLAYDTQYRNFIEIFYLIRRALFAALLAFISNGSDFQIPLLTTAILISLLLNMVYKPYVCPRPLYGIDVENTLESFNLSVLLLSFVSLGQETWGSGKATTLIWLVLALNCFTILLCVVVVVVRLVTKEEYENIDDQVQRTTSLDDD